MKTLSELRELGIEQLHEELLILRKKQFNQRMHLANGVLDKTHTMRTIRRGIARVKTLMTEKVGKS